jgi:hypothetical protein
MLGTSAKEVIITLACRTAEPRSMLVIYLCYNPLHKILNISVPLVPILPNQGSKYDS